MNTLTFSVRCFALPGHRFDRDEAEWLTAELVGESGSYLVPIVVRLSDRDTILDIQTGTCSLYDFWKGLGKSLDAIWVRDFDDGGDIDSIIRYDTDRLARTCRYGYDEIRAGLTADADRFAVLPNARRLGWERAGDDIWRLPVTGTYAAGNSRRIPARHGDWDLISASEPWDGSRLHPGPHMWRAHRPALDPTVSISTPTSPAYLTRGPFQEEVTVLDGPITTVPGPSPGLRWVELSWRGRLVNRSTWDGRWWHHACADDWDNCHDPQYLTYLLERATGSTPPT